MDVTEYRRRARQWLEENVPEPGSFSSAAQLLAVSRKYQAGLYDAGFAGITWPGDCGGQGLTPGHETAFNEAAADFVQPTAPFTIGLGMCGPTIVDLGTPGQRQRYIRKLLRGEEIWCQLYSEPGAGSDVASLQTRAVRDGGEWVVNGSKIWTTSAQWADFGTLLARTDPGLPKHQGLTMFLLDMRLDGVTVRPLRDMTGRTHFNEVFFDNVRIPADSVLGEVGGGWRAAVIQLGHERVSIGGTKASKRSPLAFESLAELARRSGSTADPALRERLADQYAAERALDLLNVRMRQEAQAGGQIGARGSVAKLAGSLLNRAAVDLAGELAGARAVAWPAGDRIAGELATGISFMPQFGIAGGTNEIQRKIIGERILKLPKEPQADKDVPFRDLRVGTQLRESAS